MPIRTETIHHAGHYKMGYCHCDATADGKSSPTDFIEVHHGRDATDHLDDIYHARQNQRCLSFLPEGFEERWRVVDKRIDTRELCR